MKVSLWLISGTKKVP